MKKTLFTLVFALLGVISTFAQINITAKGRVTNMILAADSYCCVIKNDNNYELRVSFHNREGSDMISVILGPDEKSASKSLAQINEWLDTSTISEYIILEQNGESITLYRSHPNRFLISTGDQYYCKQLMTAIATGWDTDAAIPYGYCSNVVIKKALKRFSSGD